MRRHRGGDLGTVLGWVLTTLFLAAVALAWAAAPCGALTWLPITSVPARCLAGEFRG